MNGTNMIPVSEALKCLLMIARLWNDSMVNDPMFTAVRARESAREHFNRIGDVTKAVEILDTCKNDATRTQATAVLKLAGMEWPTDDHGNEWSRARVAIDIWQTAQLWRCKHGVGSRFVGLGCEERRNWYEAWREAVLEAYYMLVELAAERLMDVI